jgi:hypothetical protein
MPAKSQAQQKLMGLVHAIQQGKAAPSGGAGEIAHEIDPSAADDFASTSQEGLPQHVDDSANIAAETISKYNEYGKHFQAAMTMGELAERLMQVAEFAEQAVMSEADDWFDKHTVSRNMKEMKSYVKEFSKVAMEHDGLRQRMSALYDDMGRVLERYFEIGGAGKAGDEGAIDENPDINYDTGEDEIHIANSDKNPVPSGNASHMAPNDDAGSQVTQMAGWLPSGKQDTTHGAPFDMDDEDMGFDDDDDQKLKEDQPENLYPSLRDGSESEMRFEDDEPVDEPVVDDGAGLKRAKNLSERIVRLARERLKGETLVRFDTLPREIQIKAAWKLIR